MENFFYSLEQNRSFKRQVKFLRAINQASKAKTLMEWKKEINCSLPTLRSDVVYLNATLSSYIDLSISQGGQVKANMVKGCSIDIAISHLAKETFSYQIIDALYHCRNWSLQKSLSILSISRTKFFKIINHMNMVLRDFNLTILTNPLRFEGCEEDIRVFLFHFYADFSDLSIIGTESKMLTQSLEKTVHESDFPHLYLCYFRLNLWMEIICLRWRYKQFVTISKELKATLIKTTDFLNFIVSLQRTTQGLNDFSSFPQDELMWLYIVMLDFVVYSEKPSQDNKGHTVTYRRNVEDDVLAFFWQFLFKSLPRDVLINSSLNFSKIEAFLVNMRLLSQLTPSFEKVAPKLKSFIQQYYSKSYHFWKNALEEHLCRTTFPFYYTDDVAVGLTILYQNSLKAKKQTKGLVLFAFQGAKGFDDYLKIKSTEYLVPNVEVKYFLEHTLTEEDINQTQANLVVCNYYFSLKNQDVCPVIRLSNIPTDAEWDLVQKQIKKVAKQA